MATKNNPGKWDCHAKAAPDEPTFTLIARDPTMGAMLVLWNVLRGRACGQATSSEQAAEAHECSLAAIRYAGGLGGGRGDKAMRATALAKLMVEALHNAEEMSTLLASCLPSSDDGDSPLEPEEVVGFHKDMPGGGVTSDPPLPHEEAMPSTERAASLIDNFETSKR